MTGGCFNTSSQGSMVQVIDAAITPTNDAIINTIVTIIFTTRMSHKRGIRSKKYCKFNMGHKNHVTTCKGCKGISIPLILMDPFGISSPKYVLHSSQVIFTKHYPTINSVNKTENF